jgi:hypothetical protein
VPCNERADVGIQSGSGKFKFCVPNLNAVAGDRCYVCACLKRKKHKDQMLSRDISILSRMGCWLKSIPKLRHSDLARTNEDEVI